MVKVFTRLWSSIEASRRVALDSVLVGGGLLLPARGRVGRFALLISLGVELHDEFTERALQRAFAKQD